MQVVQVDEQMQIDTIEPISFSLQFSHPARRDRHGSVLLLIQRSKWRCTSQREVFGMPRSVRPSVRFNVKALLRLWFVITELQALFLVISRRLLRKRLAGGACRSARSGFWTNIGVKGYRSVDFRSNDFTNARSFSKHPPQAVPSCHMCLSSGS